MPQDPATANPFIYTPLAQVWSLEASRLTTHLQTDSLSGLSEEEAGKRLERCGANELRAQDRMAPWQIFLAQIRSPVVITLAFASILSLALGEWIDGLAIVSILLLNAGIGFFQELRADRAIEALKALTQPQARVLRDGHVRIIAARAIVPGDLLLLSAGDYVAADARILTQTQLVADEAALTGESLPTSKGATTLPPDTTLVERNNCLFAGTAIVQGSAQALVYATGMHTELGHLAALMNATQREPTQLQKRMAEANRLLLWLAAGVILLIFGLGLKQNLSLAPVTMSALSLAIAAIPEGLPAVVTIALALAVRRMSQRKAIIRYLPAVETLGSCQVICTDKTGTLTSGKMQVREWISREGQFTMSPDHSVLSGQDLSPGLLALLRGSVLASSSHRGGAEPSMGDPSELAIYTAADILTHQLATWQTEHPSLYEWHFDSHRKRMSVLRRPSAGPTLYVKGAPESILPLCSLPHDALAHWMATVQHLSARGRRLLAVAQKSCESEHNGRAWHELRDEEIETNLEFLGLVALADPPRPESREAIARCVAAGIKVVMITGDHPTTALAIAEDLGLVTAAEENIVLTGSQLMTMSQEELKEAVLQTKIYARVSPEDKLRIIEAWKQHHMTVAMTGDGVNDAAALKAASIGIAMGQGGTEVARQAAALILTDDNFQTIVSAVEEGRGIFGNIQRTIQYLLSGNLGEIVVMLGAAMLGSPFPLWPIQLLWINLVTDGLPSLALGAEPLSRNVLKESHRPSASSFFTLPYLTHILMVGLLVGGLGLFLYERALRDHNLETARSITFSFLVFEELFRSFAYRNDRIPFLSLKLIPHPFHLLAVSVPFILHFLILYWSPSHAIFHTVTIPLDELGVLVLVALIPVTLIESMKIIRYGFSQSPSRGRVP